MTVKTATRKKAAGTDGKAPDKETKLTPPVLTPEKEAEYIEREAKAAARLKRKVMVKKRAEEIFAVFDKERLKAISLESIMSEFSDSRDQARCLIDTYYSMQDYRKITDQHQLAHSRQNDANLGISVVTQINRKVQEFEDEISGHIREWVKNKPLCQWAMSNHGIGHILAAGLFAHIDFETCNCPVYKGTPRHKRPPHDCPGLHAAGSVWKFAGLTDPSIRQWEKGTRRPYNQNLKQICFLIGESFAKLVNNRKSFYSQLYLQKKEYYTKENERGAYKEQVFDMLRSHNRKPNAKALSDEHRACWEAGMRQPCGIDRMAKRYATTIFISHYFHVGQELRGRGPVAPYAMVHLGHAHYIPPPNYKDGKIYKDGKVIYPKK